MNLREPWQPSTILKPVRLNRDSHDSLSFSYMPVFEVKRTILVKGFQLPRLDRTIQSRFQNLTSN